MEEATPPSDCRGGARRGGESQRSVGIRDSLGRRVTAVALTDAASGRVPLIYLPVAVSIAVLGILGIVAGGLFHADAFGLDEETNIPATVSALLLIGSAVLVLAYSGVGHRGERHYPGILMALVIGYMALDEVAQFHESVERRTGVDWQTLYLPVIVMAGATWALILRELRADARAAAYWVIAAVAWSVAQALEFVQWDAADNPVRYYSAMMVSEELLEMVGSSLFGLAMLCAIGASVRRNGR